jgi:hypothetical protein
LLRLNFTDRATLKSVILASARQLGAKTRRKRLL